MKTTKKILSILLVLALVLATLAGCSSTNDDSGYAGDDNADNLSLIHI